MTVNQSYYKSEIENFTKKEGYVIATTNVLGFKSPGYSLLALTHENLEFVYSFILVGIIGDDELYRLVYKNVITYEL